MNPQILKEKIAELIARIYWSAPSRAHRHNESFSWFGVIVLFLAPHFHWKILNFFVQFQHKTTKLWPSLHRKTKKKKIWDHYIFGWMHKEVGWMTQNTSIIYIVRRKIIMMKMIQTTNMNNYFGKKTATAKKKWFPLDGPKHFYFSFSLFEEKRMVKWEKMRSEAKWNWFNLIFCSLFIFFFSSKKNLFHGIFITQYKRMNNSISSFK